MSNIEIENKYYVYFYYDVNNQLLYVGLSNNIYKRFSSHMNDKNWSSQISSIGYREYPNESSMRFAETYYIGKLKPKYNITGNYSDELFMDMNDPSREIILDKNTFILKNSAINNSVSKKKMTAKEQYINDGWDIIAKSSINLFADNIMCLDLNKTVFYYDESYFYLKSTGPLKDGESGVNTTIKYLKSYFTSNVQLHRNNTQHLFISLTHHKKTSKGYYNLIGNVGGTSDYIDKVSITEFNFLNVSDDKFIIDFSLINWPDRSKKAPFVTIT